MTSPTPWCEQTINLENTQEIGKSCHGPKTAGITLLVFDSLSSKLTFVTRNCLEGLMLKLKLQYFGHLMWRTDSFEKTLMLRKIERRKRRDDRGWDGWMASLTQWTWVWVNSGSWWWTGRPGVLRSVGSQRVRHDWATELNWMWYQEVLAMS